MPLMSHRGWALRKLCNGQPGKPIITLSLDIRQRQPSDSVSPQDSSPYQAMHPIEKNNECPKCILLERFLQLNNQNTISRELVTTRSMKFDLYM